MKRLIITLMAAAAFALPAGNSATVKPPPTGKLVIYRAGGIGFAVKLPFMLDGDPHNLGYGKYREFTLPAGMHKLSRTDIWLGNFDIVQVNVPANGTVYFQCLASFPNVIFEIASDQARAQRSAGKCKPQIGD
jgi:hypothetical protein